MKLRIATRGSPLARWQAEHVAQLLSPNEVELVIVRTEGDRSGDVSLQKIGGLGVFTKEVQQAVLRNEADIAVHSLKDLPTEPTSGLIIAAVPERGPVNDVLVSKHRSFDALPNRARIATGSVRRRAMIRHQRPDLQLVDIRGNVDTRLRKMEDDNLDGLILAEAGLQRLGLLEKVAEQLDISWMVPAVGQGALAIECRIGDDRIFDVISTLDHSTSHFAVIAERAFLNAFGGGCQIPLGGLASVEGNRLSLHGCWLSEDGVTRREATEEGNVNQAAEIGQRLAQRLL